MSAAEVAIGGLLLSVAVGIGGYVYGFGQGKAAEKGRQDSETVQSLTQQIGAHADLIKQSKAVSRDLRRAVSLREQADQKSSQELSHELNATADSRTGCVFPTGVMRGLSAARDRAAQAAADGIGSAVPDAPTSATGVR
ncbi:hypothetical protein [Acidovorax sp. SUPP3334]|uniref:hypothetical protein n=1 Tax=Acidovorax sp. SUPP3334 TaxID=2920881 RepID=UPI0023DE505C|nr:hypothetical protein [Acidovorax sp. SUPP3334]GKT21679.1 hypothetical protein AVHM3334_05630 [Acidovorax sp. SUPP3334]